MSKKPAKLPPLSSKTKTTPKKTSVGSKTTHKSTSKPHTTNQESTKVVETVKPSEPVLELPPLPLTEEEKKRINSSIKIQTAWRCYRARRRLAELRSEKKKVDEHLLKLEQEAYLRMIRLEQEREEREFEKRMKQEAARRARETRRKKFLEAAYDGKLADLEYLIDDMQRELASDPKLDPARRRQLLVKYLLDCRDSNEYTPLSEASAGGSSEVVKFLLSQEGVDVNSRGSFGRTPLWRSSFAGHLECIELLLKNGADPRIYSSDGQRCIDAATQPEIIDVLEKWNIELTNRMLEQIVKRKHEQQRQLESELAQRKRAARNEFAGVQSQLERCKIELFKCRVEIQRLNDEYLLKPDMYGPLIEKKESERGELEARYESLRERVVKARIVYKELAAEIRRERRQIKEEEKDKTVSGQENTDNDDEDDQDGDSSDDEEIDERKVTKRLEKF